MLAMTAVFRSRSLGIASLHSLACGNARDGCRVLETPVYTALRAVVLATTAAFLSRESAQSGCSCARDDCKDPDRKSAQR